MILICCNDAINKVVVDEKTGNKMLVGRTDINIFQQPEYSEWYNNEYFGYEPDKFILDQIKMNIDSINIQIFMGTWCSDSRREVPRFIKILDQLNFDKNNLQLINLDRKKHSPNSEEKDKNIELVPTFILSKNEIEIDRIIEFPIVTLESDILNILLGI